jgi:hypothetical protein
MRFVNKSQLPFPIPFLDLFLSYNRFLYIIVRLIIYKDMHIIFICKSIYNILFVFINPFNQIICHTNIQRTIFSACKNVNVILFHITYVTRPLKNCLKPTILSFLRKQESSIIKQLLDSRLRGNDKLRGNDRKCSFSNVSLHYISTSSTEQDLIIPGFPPEPALECPSRGRE